MKGLILIAVIISTLLISISSSQSISGINIQGDVTRGITVSNDYYSTYFNVSAKSISGTTIGNNSADYNVFDAINFKVSMSDLNLYFNYSKYYSYSRNSPAFGTQYNFNYKPTCIIEYLETNNKPGYQYGEDRVVGWLRLDTFGYQYTQSKQSIYKSGTAQYVDTYNFNVFPKSSSSSSSSDAIFQATFYFTTSAVSINSDPLGSGQTKMVFQIKNYFNTEYNTPTSGCESVSVSSTNPIDCPSTGPSSYSTSKLALSSVIFSSYNDFGTDLGRYKIMVNNTEGHNNTLIGGTWSSEASSSGYNAPTIPVITTATNTVNGNMFVFNSFGYFSQLLFHSFNYNQPDAIVWGPTLGVVIENSSSTKVIIPTLMIIFTILLNLLM